jgi:predicted Zn-dependent peptidase
MCVSVSLFAQETSKGTSVKAVQRLNRAPVNHEVLQVTLPKPQEIKLPNGLTVLLLERHKLPTVNFVLWVDTGSLDDPANMPGLAMFTAEMMREGTAKRTSSQLAQEIDALGATINTNAEFGSTYTQIRASGFSADSDRLLDLMSDVVLNPTFSAEELEKYKKRELSNLEEQRAEPGFLAEEQIYRALYGSSAAAVVSATPASVQAVSANDLNQFHTTHYIPNNSMLGVVGDFDSKNMSGLVQKYFGVWKQGTAKPSSPGQIPAAGAYKITLVDRPDSVQTNILAGELGVTRKDPEFYSLRVMNRVLGEGVTGRLFLNLREEKGYTYGAYSSFDPDTYPRPLIANTEVRTAVTDGSMHEMLGELGRLRDEPVPTAELDEAERAIVAGFALSLERQAQLLDFWMEVKHDGLPDNYWDNYPAEIAKVQPPAIQAAAKKYLAPQHLQVVCVGTGSQIKDVLQKYGPVEVYDVNGKKMGQ